MTVPTAVPFFRISFLPGLFLLTVFQTWPVSARQGPFLFEASEPVFMPGDSPGWRMPDYNDRAWQSQPPFLENRWWARVVIVFAEPGPETESLVVGIHAVGSYEAYWDGHYLGDNGRIGSSKEDEEQGNYYKQFILPTDLTSPGRHTLALRVSSFHTLVNMGYFRIEVGEIGRIHMVQYRKTALFMVVLGILCVCGLLFLFHYINGRSDPATLLFGLLATCVAVLLGLEYSKFLVHYPYSYHLFRLSLISLFTMVVGFLLPFFLLVKLRAPHRVPIAILIGCAILAAPLMNLDFDAHCLTIFFFSLSVSFILTLWGIFTGKKESLILSTGVGACFFPTLFTGPSYADHYFFLSFLIMVAILTGRMFWDIRLQKIAYEKVLVRAALLKYEMLKKNIQPHFLMNSLAAAISWIEENPVKGIDMLKALSRELEAFFKIGERALIPLGEELSLCGHHVETMGFMLDCPLRLICEDVNPELPVPPGLFLTLVENALTHGVYDESGGHVTVKGEFGAGIQTFTVTNPVVAAEPSNQPQDGAGFSYIKTLLEQHYPNRWRLSWERDRAIWRTELRIVGDPVP